MFNALFTVLTHVLASYTVFEKHSAYRAFSAPLILQDGDASEAITSLSSAQSLLSELWEAFLYRLPGLALGIVIMAAFILVAPHAAKILVKPFTRTTTSPLLRSVIQRSVGLVLILLGIYLFLFLAGLTGFAIAVVSGTGVVGLILGFAFRDIAENFISSLLLTIQRPFRIGDIVQVNDFTGIIQKVTARATTLVDFDGNHIQIPNATIYKGVIKNLTANPLMRGHFVIGVGYDSDIQEAQQIAQRITAQQEKVLKDPEPQILIDELGASTYNVKVYFWVDVETTSVLKMASVLMRNITQAFLDANISMPDDARERIFPQGLLVQNASDNAITDEPETLKEVGPSSIEQNVNALSREASTNENKGLDSMDDDRSKSFNKNLQRDADSHAVKNQPREASATTDKKTMKGAPIDDDVSSEAKEIREQARRSRDPEAGENIL